MFDTRRYDAIPLIRSMDDSVAAMAAATAELLEAVAAFDEHECWSNDGATSMTPWLAARYCLTWGTAREWVRVARALRELPAIARAFWQGGLSWDQLRPLTKFASPETDDRLAREAQSCSSGWLWQEARRHEHVGAADAVDAHRRRYCSLTWNEEKTELHVDAMLPGERGASFEHAVSRRAERVVVADDPLDKAEARTADALTELVTGAGDGEASPATLVVHADAHALTSEDATEGPWLAESDSGARLASEEVRRLACDSRIEWVLEREGRVVGIGRRGRVVPGQIGRILRHRDRGCRFPGCERRNWLAVHHLVHWAKGGSTDLDNLVLLCHAHHRLIHEGGWKTSGHPSRDLRFHDPTGRRLRTASESRMSAA